MDAGGPPLSGTGALGPLHCQDRATVEQYAADLLICTPEEVAALKEKMQELQGVQPMEAKDADRAE